MRVFKILNYKFIYFNLIKHFNHHKVKKNILEEFEKKLMNTF